MFILCVLYWPHKQGCPFSLSCSGRSTARERSLECGREVAGLHWSSCGKGKGLQLARPRGGDLEWLGNIRVWRGQSLGVETFPAPKGLPLGLAVGQLCFSCANSVWILLAFWSSFYFYGTQLRCWHSWLGNAFWPRGPALGKGLMISYIFYRNNFL